MLKDNELVGAIVIYRQEVRPFTDKQIELGNRRRLAAGTNSEVPAPHALIVSIQNNSSLSQGF
jgi:hypothetical protein